MTTIDSRRPAAAGPAGRRRRLGILSICCLSLFLVGLDNTIILVALPSIGRDLDTSLSGLQWTVDAYLVVLASFLMLAGSTADRVGRRRVFQLGLVIFTLGSLLCSLAAGVGMLVAFRILQALGGSMLNPVAMSIVTNTFLDPKERARAIGIWGGVAGLSMAVGPLLGGALVDWLGWRSVFWVNVPVGIAALVLTARYVPESRAGHARRIDPVGQILVVTMLAAATYGIIEGPRLGWASAGVIGCGIATVAALVALIGYERRRSEPLVELRFFRSAPFSGAVVIAVCAFAALATFLLLNALYLQDVRGYTALAAGLWTIPFALTALVLAPLSGRLVASRGPRLPLLAGGAAMLASALVLLGLTATSGPGRLITAYVLFGVGFGFVNAPITNTAVSGMPLSRSGMAAAVASSSRQLGQALGIAIAGTVIATQLAGGLGSGTAGFTDAARLCWWIVAGYGTVVLALGLVTTGRWAAGTAERAAGELEPVTATR